MSTNGAAPDGRATASGPGGDRPLSDIRIVSLEQYGAGPFGTLHLADLGAEIIKIENPQTEGDVGRYVPPYAVGEDSLFFETFNRGKRSIGIDITEPAGRAVFEDLVRHADVVYSNLRGDVPERLGICYRDLAHVNPAIVCVSLSGYGMTGPRKSEPAYDYILQGLAGWMSVSGEPLGPPTRAGLSLVDYSGGYVAAIAILAGVHQARRDGIGMDCDLSLFDTAISLLTYLATWHLTEGYQPVRTAQSAHPSLVPFQNFQTRDGWIVVACAKEKFWQRLAAAVGRPELPADARYLTASDRLANADELLAVLAPEFLREDTARWIEILTEAGVPCGSINSVGEALLDPQVQDRQLVVETEHASLGTVRQVVSPVRVGPWRSDYDRAPLRNEDETYVLADVLGYSQSQIESLRQSGTVRGAPAKEAR